MGILTKLEEKLEGNSKSKNPLRQEQHGIAQPGTTRCLTARGLLWPHQNA